MWKQMKRVTKSISGWLYWWMHLITFYLRRDTTIWSIMDMCILKIEKKSSVKKIRLTALGAEGFYSFSQLNTSYDGTVLPLVSPLRCSSSQRNAYRLGFVPDQCLASLRRSPKRGLVSCVWEDVEICLVGNNQREFDKAEHGFGVTACLSFSGQPGAVGLVLQYGSQATISESFQNHPSPHCHHTMPHEGA